MDNLPPVPADALTLLETPPGEETPPPPRLLGYGSRGGNGYSYAGGYPGGIYDDSYGGGELTMMASEDPTLENLAQAAIVLVIGVAIIISNIIVLATFITMPG